MCNLQALRIFTPQALTTRTIFRRQKITVFPRRIYFADLYCQNIWHLTANVFSYWQSFLASRAYLDLVHTYIHIHIYKQLTMSLNKYAYHYAYISDIYLLTATFYVCFHMKIYIYVYTHILISKCVWLRSAFAFILRGLIWLSLAWLFFYGK